MVVQGYKEGMEGASQESLGVRDLNYMIIILAL